MKFSLDARTYTLRYQNRDQDGVIIDDNTNYIVPIYQRPYSWSETQINIFLRDIFASFINKDQKGESEPLFIGTFLFACRDNGLELEIVDGQQRITTLILILKVLKLAYPDSSLLSELSFDWFKTKVNNGDQQRNLDSFLSLKEIDVNNEENLNLYITNAIKIHTAIIDHINNADEFDIDQFVRHIYSGVYFVAIQTKDGLTKTLKIFDTINTTGLALNAGDIFKIRMYEYMKRKGHNENAFNEINQTYKKIEDGNQKLGYLVTDIKGILHIYQFYIIGKHNMSTALYSLGVETFYDRLFETMFNINKWPSFKNSVELGELELHLEDINDIIDERYNWQLRWQNGAYGNALNKSMVWLWWWSRYGRFWTLMFLFLFKFRKQEDRYEKLFKFSNQLVKIYLIYSIFYQRIVDEIRSKFNNELIRTIIHGNIDEVMSLINRKLEDQVHAKDWLKDKVAGDISYSYKVKNILCRLSAILEENYTTNDSEEIQNIERKLFSPKEKKKKIDIEHIQSANDEDIEQRPIIIDEWGKDLNSIGNLVVLESWLNKKIQNKRIKKMDAYKKSEFEIVRHNLVADFDQWDLEKCRNRKKAEVDKIMKFLFRES